MVIKSKTNQQLIIEITELRKKISVLERRLQEACELSQASINVSGLPYGSFEKIQQFTEGIVETVRQPLVVLTPDLRIINANPSFYETFHVTPAETKGLHIYSVGDHVWDIPELRELLEEIIPQNAHFNNFEVDYEFPAIGRKIMLLNARRIFLEGKGTEIILLAFEDTTAQKQAEEALQVSEKRYRRLFETAQDGILILDAETGNISDVNPFMAEMLGYSKDDFIGKKLWEIGAFKDVEESKASFAELQTKGYVRYEDLPLETKDGNHVAVEFVSNVYLVNNHKVIQCNIRNIVKRKLIADALKKAHAETERQVEERTAELRTALSEIKTLKDQLEAENVYFRQDVETKHQFDKIVGQSDGLKYVLYRAEKVSASNTTVLILGETGTGKELVAAAIHNLSPRKARTMITVNCAALPANLMESELFGREKGAFTGADTRQFGRFEIANGSTLCLDEIGELPLEMQAKLLRAIQNSEFERLGSSQTIKVDVRIIATTNRDLDEEVRKGRFRQDLYYRLNVFPITVPPLRQRAEDIPALVQVFVERYGRKLGKEITSVHKETIRAFKDYAWPGNIRELESVIERAIILCPGPVLRLEDKLENPFLPVAGMMTLEDMERNQILKTLVKCKWRINGENGASAILGLHPSTLRARINKLGITRPET